MDISEVKKRYLSEFKRRFDNVDNVKADARASWLASLRQAAIGKFIEMGFPTTRDEEWKYTSVDLIAALDFGLPHQKADEISTKDLLALAFADETCNRLVFIDGAYSTQHSSITNLQSGVFAKSLAELLSQENELVAPWIARYAKYSDKPFIALNTAFIEDGAGILIPENCRVDEPIYAIFATSGGRHPVVSHPRNLFVYGKGSEAKIVEVYVGLGDGAYFSNPVTEISAGANSIIDHYRLQSEAAQAFHVGALSARLERNATLTSHNLTLSGRLVRSDVHTILDGEGAQCMLNGLYLSDARQHIDNHTEIEHARPRATSHELYKGILSGQAHGVFNGKIVVHKDAQKSDARQSNKNLLLSKDAVINSKPQLEIYADDVKCRHGSSIGQLDRDAMFYMRSRGIAADDARSLLSYGFAAEVLTRVKVAALRDRLDGYLLTKFDRTAVVQ